MSFTENQQYIKKIFSNCSTNEEKYLKIMQLGRDLSPYPNELKHSDKLVQGCQSQVYFYTELKKNQLLFLAASDSLISAGLAHLLILIYQDTSPETVLKLPPTCLEELQIPGSLTPSRANGLWSMHLHVKQQALQLLMIRDKKKPILAS